MLASDDSGDVRPASPARSSSALRRVAAWMRVALRLLVARRLLVLALLATIAGVAFRVGYGLELHHPRHFTGSDAGELIAFASRLIDAPARQRIGDTIWPPGGAALLAPLLAADPSLGVAAAVQVVLSVLTFLLIGHMALRLAGPRAGVLALAFGACHFGFIHYTGFFLSEQWFQFATTLALWAAVLGLGSGAAPDAASATAGRLARLARGAAVGVCFGFAAGVRPNALPVALAVLGALAVHAWFVRERARLVALAGAFAGFVAVLAPLAARCTALSKGFCPVSNNFLMNAALGQAGPVMGLEFRAPGHPELDTGWVPPALLHHGYTGTHVVNSSIYDARGVLTWIFEQWRDDPGACLVRSIGNALDLFRFEYWPVDFGHVNERFATVAAQSFLLFVALPGALALGWLVVRAVRERSRSPIVPLFAATIGTVVAMAAFSLGEARYRFPFDGVLIVLAAALYTGEFGRLLAPPVARRGARFAVGGAGVTAALLALLVALVSLPAVGAARWLPHRAKLPPVENVERGRAADYADPKTNGTRWDAPGNHVFVCHAACRGLELDWPRLERAKTAEVSVDHNDRYRIGFFRGARELGAVDVLPVGSGEGLRVDRVKVPPAARAGFDRVRVLPLYGDGRYSLGHFRLLE